LKLFYNYSTMDSCTFPDGLHNEVVWEEWVSEDDEYAIFDISHWTDEDTKDFMEMHPDDQYGILENMQEENLEVI